MKNLLLFFLLLLPLLTYSQIETKVNSEKVDWEKVKSFEYYIDSIKVDIKKTFLPSHITKISVKLIDDVLMSYISSAENNISLKDLDNINENVKSIRNKIFMIDDKIIKHPSEIKIDRGIIKNIEILNSSEFEDQSAVFSIVKITTKNHERHMPTNKEVMIRGTELSMNK